MITTPFRQLVLDLPHRSALGRDDFLVTDANAAAVAIIDRFPDWPNPAMALVGEPGSGKTHLLEVWRTTSNAALAAPGQLDAAGRLLLERGALAIDNAPGAALDETGLFHLLNLARQSHGHILIASETAPVSWKVALPDLASRLKAMPVARLQPPDDVLLRGVLVKLFADRQIAVDEQVISYLLLRMPRSLDTARLLVADIDRLALEEKAAVTRPLAARVLQRMIEPELPGGL